MLKNQTRLIVNAVEVVQTHNRYFSSLQILNQRHPYGERCLLLPTYNCAVSTLDVRLMSQSVKTNLVIRFVPQQEAWVVERMGRYSKIMKPGLNFLIPFFDKIRYLQSLKEQVIDVADQQAITKDNVTLKLDGVLYVKVEDPYKASYGVEDPEYAITQLAQTSTRSELGKLQLDQVFEERQKLNLAIVDAINEASVEPWGIRCMRYEIRDIHMPEKVKEAMQLMVAAERKKRAAITESEGKRASEINVAEGVKQSTILRSEAQMRESINEAKGQAEAILNVANARAKSIEAISQSLQRKNGMSAASLAIAEQYIEAFGKLAQENNTLLLPANTGDISSMVSTALATYQKVNQQMERTPKSNVNQVSDDEPEPEKDGWQD